MQRSALHDLEEIGEGMLVTGMFIQLGEVGGSCSNKTICLVVIAQSKHYLFQVLGMTKVGCGSEHFMLCWHFHHLCCGNICCIRFSWLDLIIVNIYPGSLNRIL